jgi:hypothetical protein
LSSIQKIQTLWLIAQKYATQDTPTQNKEDYLASLKTPLINTETTQNTNLKSAIKNLKINSWLFLITKPEKIIGKNLDKLA